MRKSKLIGAVIVAILIIIQLIPSGRPDVIKTNKSDLLVNNSVPDSVAHLFKNACYNCHSNETTYPWYSYVAPVSWLVSRDVKRGRNHLNFSEWEDNSKMDKAGLLDDINDEVSDGEMPIAIYTLMHPDAKLTSAERLLIVNWTEDFADKLFE